VSLAVNAPGDAVATWIHRTDVGDVPTIRAAIRPAGGQWTAATPISAAGIAAERPKAAIDDHGDVTVVWESQNRVTGAVYDRAGPKLRALSIPDQAFARVPAAFSVAPLDTWSAVAATEWSFGDGSRASGQTLSHTFAEPGPHVVTVSSTDGRGNASTAQKVVDVQPTPLPGATTGGARRIRRRSAVITATIRPTLVPATYHFQWGARKLRRRTGTVAVEPNGPTRAVTARLRRLVPGTVYRYRVVASYCDGCPTGTASGPEVVFRTAPPRRIASTLAYELSGNGDSFTAMRITKVPKGSKVAFRCKGTCGVRNLDLKRRGTVELAKLVGARFGNGARLEIRVVKRFWVGKSFVLRMRAGRKPALAISCIPLAPPSATDC
jgi:hypothetical protein